jgi:hypothetical protein
VENGVRYCLGYGQGNPLGISSVPAPELGYGTSSAADSGRSGGQFHLVPQVPWSHFCAPSGLIPQDRHSVFP